MPAGMIRHLQITVVVAQLITINAPAFKIQHQEAWIAFSVADTQIHTLDNHTIRQPDRTAHAGRKSDWLNDEFFGAVNMKLNI